MDSANLNTLLDKHRLWAESGGRDGSKADFSQAPVEGVDLRGADLRGAAFGPAALKGTRLRDADLAGADLSQATGLRAGQLGGADLSGAKLPPDALPAHELTKVDELSKNAGAIFVSMLAACLYAWLTIAATLDVQLLTNSVYSKLPIIQTEIPIVLFYTVAPLILLGIYIYLHLYLQRLWEALAALPAVFPDGTTLDKRSYPWLLNDLVRDHFPRLRGRPLPLFRVQSRLSIFLAWWVTPITLLFFWARYLARHEWVVTALHLAVLAASVGAGLAFYRLAAGTLRDDRAELDAWRRPLRSGRMRARIGAGLGTGVFLAAVSLCCVYGVPPDRYDTAVTVKWDAPDYSRANPRRLIPRLLEVAQYRPFAEFREADVSTKPPNWRGVLPQDGVMPPPPPPEEVNLVKGAHLKGSDLSYATGFRAFLVKADLQGARLVGADLWNADLRGADLGHADLTAAHLGSARLDGAGMARALLTKAFLRNAYFTRANLRGADLRDADLTGAKLQEAVLSGAVLAGARLGKADLRGAKLDADPRADPRANFGEADLHGAVYDRDTLWPDGFDPKAHGAKGDKD